MNIDHTPKELAKAIKLARQNKWKIEVNKYQYCNTVTIEGLSVGCGYGTVVMSIPKSHRTSEKMLRIDGVRWYCSALNYKTFYYTVPNNEDSINQAKKLGARISRSFGSNKEIKHVFKVVSKKQQAAYDMEVMKRD